ncbi:MAG: 50S ribosomal protein L25 [Chloroflexi bacterium]|nr:50S ribosomal protein L25 [Chloroflexota bacterium]
MAERTELEVAPRTVMGKANKRLRKAGLIPANIYGHKQAPLAIQIDTMAFDRLRRAHGTRSVLSLRLPDAAPQTALLRHVQYDPRTGKVLHVDFTRVSLSERINVKVPLRFVGEAPGVKVEGGILLPLLEAIEVECRVSDMVEAIEVDVTTLTDIDASLHASDVKLPPRYTLVTDPEESIVKIAAPRIERVEEEAAAEAPAPEAEAPAAPPASPAE